MRLLAALLIAAAAGASAAEPLRVGSKRFTESYVLGEVLVQAAARAGTKAEHRQGLGNTGIVFAALRSGAIDLYPDYSGTIAREILRLEGRPGLDDLARGLAPQGLGVAVPLGFHNGYALAMREELAARLGVRRLSELASHPGLRFGLSQEFLARADGWRGLGAAYGLTAVPAGLDHGLAYEAVRSGQADVIDVYTTDAKLERYRLRILEDDRNYFPRYDALLVYRLDVPGRFPAAWEEIRRLAGRIDEPLMIRMNAVAELERRSFSEAAALLGASPGVTRAAPRGFWNALAGPDFARLTLEHLWLVFASLAGSIAAGVPLGVLAARRPALAQPILATVGIIQTVPSIALLAFLIALMGAIGMLPALAALFLYALLPIVRGAHTGLGGVGGGVREAALALGLRPGQCLRLVELPLAMPAILAGVKTSAVINVGTATIAAFVGAGGYGERIVQGLALNDSVTLLAGAIPAAGLALGVQAAFELGERRFAWHRFRI